MKFLTRLRFDESGMKDLTGMSWENIGVTFDVPGRFGGKAARFNGTSYLETNNDEFDFEKEIDFTVALWIRYENARNYMHQTLLGSYVKNKAAKYGQEYCALYASVYANGIPCCSVADVFDDRMVVGGDHAYDDNMWHHIALTRNEKVVRLFIDGKLKSTDTSGMQMNFRIGGTTMIGWLDVRIADTYYYVGELDDICIIKDCALWTTNFVPPSTYLSLDSHLYVGNGVYGMKRR